MSNAEHNQPLASAVLAPAHPGQGTGRTSDISETRTAGALTPRPGVISLPGQQLVTSMPRRRRRALPGPVIWGAVWGALQAMSPLGFWWLAPKTVYALGLTLIAAVYIGFSVADGRWKVIAAESIVAAFFVVIAAVSVSGSAWLLVLGLAGHGLKDLWQHRTQFVRNTRWWPPFCATVDWVAAGILTTAILMGIHFHG
jgi:hypothetical protein